MFSELLIHVISKHLQWPPSCLLLLADVLTAAPITSTRSNVSPLSASGCVTVRLPQEQTLLLQQRSEGDQLAKLGEAQKHFSVLSRQCAAIKEAHQKLEQSGENTLYLISACVYGGLRTLLPPPQP